MNIFVLDEDPGVAAQMMCDKHVVKMILETAQLLSTAHRVLDGHSYIEKTGKRSVKRWDHLYDIQYPNKPLYKATHVNHPCAVWCRQSVYSYIWLYEHFVALCEEYSYRYDKIHLTDHKLRGILSGYPVNIPTVAPSNFVQAMPDMYKRESAVDAYRAYYIGEKAAIARWTRRVVPDWFKENARVSSESN